MSNWGTRWNEIIERNGQIIYSQNRICEKFKGLEELRENEKKKFEELEESVVFCKRENKEEIGRLKEKLKAKEENAGEVEEDILRRLWKLEEKEQKLTKSDARHSKKIEKMLRQVKGKAFFFRSNPHSFCKAPQNTIKQGIGWRYSLK